MNDVRPRDWQENAAEFERLTKQGRDARLALLVACSVERLEKGSGGDPDALAQSRKGSANEFAKRAGTSKDRIIRHLDAWNRLADDGLVKHSDLLKPEHAATLEISDEAITALEARGALGTTTAGAIRGNPAQVRKLIVEDPRFRAEIITPDVTEAVVTDAMEDGATALRIADAAAKNEAVLERQAERFREMAKHTTRIRKEKEAATAGVDLLADLAALDGLVTDLLGKAALSPMVRDYLQRVADRITTELMALAEGVSDGRNA